MTGNKQPNVFDYTDYRKFLRDHYSFMKETTSFFSHRYFMNKAKINSPNFLKNVMEGKKNLSKKSIFKFTDALGLKKRETDYFENLVLFDQSSTGDKKQFYFERMKLFSRNVIRTEIEQGQSAYFSKWYHSVIRELISIRDYKGNWIKLANDVYPHITPLQAQKSVELLEKLGLVAKQADGTYSPASRNVTAGAKPVDVFLIRQYHKDSLNNAKHGIDAVSPDRRTCSSLVMSVEEKTYKEIEEEIASFRNRLTHIANKTQEPDRVYQVAIQFFPVSSILKKDPV